MLVSAGILMYRFVEDSLEVLLIHPGGPYFARKDAGAWSIPKGQVEPEEELLAAAFREFHEETGMELVDPATQPLGDIVQRAGKRVHAWAVEGDFDPAELQSCLFEMEWPPRSGQRQEFPEADRAEWFSLSVARKKINVAQSAFLGRLAAQFEPPDDPR
jgi:predicted NUDIX family NTP pyrophosphohydrolase